MSLELIKEFDFSTPGDWDLTGDAEIPGGVLSLEDPLEALTWDLSHWTAVPPAYGDDRRPALGTIYVAYDGMVYYALEDFEFVVPVQYLAGAGGLHFYMHYDALTTTDYLDVFINRVGGSAVRCWIYKNEGSATSQDLGWNTNWPMDSWKSVHIRCIGHRLTVSNGEMQSGCLGMDMDETDLGTVAIEAVDVNQWVLGGGAPSSYHEPRLYLRRQGSCKLKSGSAWTFPDGITSLGRVGLVADLTGGGVIPLKAKLEYSHNGGAWTAVPDDGDLSGLSVSAGESFLVGLADGSGHGLDNVTNPDEMQGDMRYVPQIHKILVGHTVAGTTAAHRRDAVTAGPRRGDYD